MTMHADQLHIDARTVRRLVDVQFPQWRGRPVTQLRTPGTVNAIFRIGDDLAARFPLVGHDPAQARGRDATVKDPAESRAFAPDLAGLIAAMRAEDTLAPLDHASKSLVTNALCPAMWWAAKCWTSLALRLQRSICAAGRLDKRFDRSDLGLPLNSMDDAARIESQRHHRCAT